LPKAPTPSLERFLRLATAFANELLAAIEAGADPNIRSALAAGVESVFWYFNEACAVPETDASAFDSEGSWVKHILSRYPALEQLGTQTSTETVAGSSPRGLSEVRQDFLLASLAIARQVYLSITEPVAGSHAVTLRQSLMSQNHAAEHQFLHHVASLAGFVVHEMTEVQQSSVQAEELALNLFQEDAVDISNAVPGSDDKWDWFIAGETNVLAFSIFEALRPTSVARLVCISSFRCVIIVLTRRFSSIRVLRRALLHGLHPLTHRNVHPSSRLS
jgi:DNA repair/transcription protein MET18/MMS19